MARVAASCGLFFLGRLYFQLGIRLGRLGPPQV